MDYGIDWIQKTFHIEKGIKFEGKTIKFKLKENKVIECPIFLVSHNCPEINVEEVDLEEIESAEEIVNYAMKGEIELKMDNILDILEGAKKINNIQILDWINEFIFDNLSRENVLDFINNSWIDSQKGLYAKMMTLISQNISFLLRNYENQLYQLGKQHFEGIVFSDLVYIENEMDFFKFIYNWLAFNHKYTTQMMVRERFYFVPKKIREQFAKYKNLIRYGLLSEQDFRIVASFGFLEDSEVNLFTKWFQSQIIYGNEDEEKAKRKTKKMQTIQDDLNKKFFLPFSPRNLNNQTFWIIPTRMRNEENFIKEEKKKMETLESVIEMMIQIQCFFHKKFPKKTAKEILNYILISHYKTSDISYSPLGMRQRMMSKKEWWGFIFTDLGDVLFVYSPESYLKNPIISEKSLIYIAQINHILLSDPQLISCCKLFPDRKLLNNFPNSISSRSFLQHSNLPIFGNFDLFFDEDLSCCFTNWGTSFLPLNLSTEKPLLVKEFDRIRFWDFLPSTIIEDSLKQNENINNANSNEEKLSDYDDSISFLDIKRFFKRKRLNVLDFFVCF
ncbi:btb/poz domain-containing [Anaeramoeba ignava]|uniref:Btb/poz domain-containing n=1 Tax=Anaeramoeba ignava TaxID=1746090 RepID=A0A9Q0LFM3_ANAIG|nr:btb/poz domain-containing [Anaeramoeba ignava]